MKYKSVMQKEALLKQGKYLQKFNKQNEIFKTNEDKQKVIDLYLSGKSSVEISKMFKCSKPVILRILKNIPKRKVSDYSSHKCHNQYGKDNHAWKGGIKDIYSRFRDLKKYFEWRTSVLIRDNNKCTSCSSVNKLHSHHIKTLKTLILEYCSSRNKIIADLTKQDLLDPYFYNLDNGLTLCEDCHKKWHKENGR